MRVIRLLHGSNNFEPTKHGSFAPPIAENEYLRDMVASCNHLTKGETEISSVEWKKQKKNYTQSANVRMPDGLREAITDAAKKRKMDLPTWSGNDEYVYRLQRSFKVPDDIIAACIEMGDVKDRLDFAVRLFKQAGMNVSIPEE